MVKKVGGLYTMKKWPNSLLVCTELSSLAGYFNFLYPDYGSYSRIQYFSDLIPAVVPEENNCRKIIKQLWKIKW